MRPELQETCVLVMERDDHRVFVSPDGEPLTWCSGGRRKDDGAREGRCLL
jgi:hypothetical protein